MLWRHEVQEAFAFPDLEKVIRLQQRLNCELPLLACLEQSQVIVALSVDRVSKLAELFQSRAPLATVQAQAQLTEATLAELCNQFDELPTLVDVPVINDLLLLASAEQDPPAESIALRLPLLLQWIEEEESLWKCFAELCPPRASLAQRASLALQALKEVAGGVYTYLEQQEPLSELREALQLGVRVLEGLAPLQETRALVESEKLHFSPDLVLERAGRLLSLYGTLPDWYGPILYRWSQNGGQGWQPIRELLHQPELLDLTRLRAIEQLRLQMF